MRYDIKPYTILLVVCSLFTSCGFLDSGDNCEMIIDTNIDGDMYADLKLNDSNGNWLSLNEIIEPAVTFTNENGATLTYSIVKNLKTDKVIYNSTQVKRDECGRKTIKDDYYLKQEQSVVYGRKNVSITMSAHRKIKVNSTGGKYTNLPFQIHSSNEYLLVELNSKYYPLNTDTGFISTGQRFHTLLTLRGKNFNNVFEVIDTAASIPAIVPKGFYYSFRKGLIGYYLTNGELWFQE